MKDGIFSNLLIAYIWRRKKLHTDSRFELDLYYWNAKEWINIKIYSASLYSILLILLIEGTFRCICFDTKLNSCIKCRIAFQGALILNFNAATNLLCSITGSKGLEAGFMVAFQPLWVLDWNSLHTCLCCSS